jgi:hypothetical protein
MKNVILDAAGPHKQWLESYRTHGRQANFSSLAIDGGGQRISRVDFSQAVFENSRITNFFFYNCVFSLASFLNAKILRCSFEGCKIDSATFSLSSITATTFYLTSLTKSSFSQSIMEDCTLKECNLLDVVFRSARFSSVDFSGSTGVFDPSEWMRSNLEKTSEGYIVYKTFGELYRPSVSWDIRPGAIIEENVNPCVTQTCSSGINVSTARYRARKVTWGTLSPVWKCLIRWEWLPGVVVPWDTEGGFRCSKLQLIDVIDREELALNG